VFGMKRASYKTAPMFFIHIPKTAGTSFREAVVKQFGKDGVLQHYRLASPHTSPMVKRHYAASDDPEAGDVWGLYQRACDTGVKLICGHVRSDQYVSVAGVRNTLVILRDPLQRAISAYQHAVRHRGFTGTFRDFYSQSAMINNQARYLGEVPLEAFGLVGLTERYRETLSVANRAYGLRLKELAKNAARLGEKSSDAVSDEDREEVLRLNAVDSALHKRAGELFEERLALHSRSLPFAHCMLGEANEHSVSGLAWWEGSDDSSVLVHVRVNGRVLKSTLASEFAGHLGALRPPKGGHVGFSVAIEAEPGDRIDCVVARTGQVFPPSPVVFNRG